MKKFKFTLEKLNDLKLSRHKELKNSMQNVDKQIEYINDALLRLDDAVQSERAKMTEDCRTGTYSDRLQMYDAFFCSAASKRKTMAEQKSELQKQKRVLLDQLIRNQNEMNTLSDKRTGQFQEYCAQIQAQEEIELENFLSHKICTM